MLPHGRPRKPSCIHKPNPGGPCTRMAALVSHRSHPANEATSRNPKQRLTPQLTRRSASLQYKYINPTLEGHAPAWPRSPAIVRIQQIKQHSETPCNTHASADTRERVPPVIRATKTHLTHLDRANHSTPPPILYGRDYSPHIATLPYNCKPLNFVPLY